MRDSDINLYFSEKSLVVNRVENAREVESSHMSVDLEGLSESKKRKFKEFLDDFPEGFFSDKPTLTHFLAMRSIWILLRLCLANRIGAMKLR